MGITAGGSMRHPLVTVIAASLLLAATATAQDEPARAPDYDALAREAGVWLQEYIRVHTVNPPGNETEGARWLQQVLAREGIVAEIFESAPGRGNLYARLPGNGARRPLILLSHIDVVSAAAGEWQVDPFSGEVRDGHIWGRGAVDMKGHAIIELATMIALKRRGVPLSRDIILVANADEEARSAGSQWFTSQKRDLIQNAEYLLNEGGDNQVDAEGKTVYYGLDTGEKLPFWLRLTARGRPGHGSQPTPDNPVARLARVLGRIAAWETPLTVTPPALAYFQARATREPDPERRAWFADPVGALRDSAGRAFLTDDLYHNAILRNTVTLTGMTGSSTTNVIPSVATAELDIRLLPGQDTTAFLADLRRVIQDSTIQVTQLSTPRQAVASPVEGEVLDALRATVDRMDPGALILPSLLTGFTDSYDYRRLGIAAYGVDPFRTSAAEGYRAHGNDERVSLANVRFGVEFYFRLVERLAR
jgi:acetylornithine deacetylase/succinyl-diaminopimelate desuccinylase-like protein